MRYIISLLILTSYWAGDALAQTDKKHIHETYIESGFSHIQGDVEEFEYNISGLTVDVETFFNGSHIGLSGWSIGYRKDDLRYAEFGHMLNGKVFRTFNVKIFEFKAAGGVEWGMPTNRFDKTKFLYKKGEAISYKHIHLDRNSNIPGVGVSQDGSIYSFFELGAAKRYKSWIFQGGIKGSMMNFGIEEFELPYNVNVRKKRVIVPYGFVSVGIAVVR